MAKTFGAMMWLLGACLAAPAVISLIQRIFEIGLTPFLADGLAFYRGLLNPIFDVLHAPLQPLLNWLNWTIPSWLMDLHTLSFVGAGIGARGLAAYQAEHETLRPVGAMLAVPLLTFFGGLIFYGLVFIVIMPFTAFTAMDKSNETVVLQARSIALTFVGICAAVVAFYALNLLSD